MVPLILQQRYANDSVINLLKWAINGDPVKWRDDVVYDANKTIMQSFITAKNFTVNSEVTLTLTPLMPLIIVANTISISGTITASGKGCPGQDVSDQIGYSCILRNTPMYGYSRNSQGNGCLCGAGGGGYETHQGGGAWLPGNPGNGDDVALTATELKAMILSPSFMPFHIGLGGGGGTDGTNNGSAGAGSILLIGNQITLSSTASLLANGLNDYECGGGGGFIGLVSSNLNVDGAATLSSAGGVGSATTGGNGAIAQIEV